MTKLFWPIGFVLGATLGHAAVLYTFSDTGANPYSFSFLEPSILTTTGRFAIPPFQVGGLTFTQATLTQTGGTGCFQFGTFGASLTATTFSCGLSAFAPEGGWQSLFLGATAPGTYTAFNAASDGSAPAAPTQLTIRNVAAFEYTFSRSGPNPYSFSFLEPAILGTTGAFAIAPFQVDGLTFTQATLTQANGTGCFQFGTAGASLTATPFSCGLSAFAPEGGWQSLFLGATAPGTYTAFNAASGGSAPAAPDQLSITELPEPASLVLFAAGLAVLAAIALNSRGRYSCPRSSAFEYLSLKGVESPLRIVVCLRREARLAEGEVEKLLGRPAFVRDLGQQQAVTPSALDVHAVEAYPNGVDAADQLHRRQHGDLNFGVGGDANGSRAARIVERGGEGHRGNNLGDRQTIGHLSDTSEQLPIAVEGDEDGGAAFQGRQVSRRHRFAAAGFDQVAQRGARAAKQLGLFLLAHRERASRKVAERAVADAGLIVAGDLAGSLVVERLLINVAADALERAQQQRDGVDPAGRRARRAQHLEK